MKNAYSIGEEVPEDGIYICVPCGYKLKLNRGDKYPECISCLERHKDVDMKEISDQGTWEKV